MAKITLNEALSGFDKMIEISGSKESRVFEGINTYIKEKAKKIAKEKSDEEAIDFALTSYEYFINELKPIVKQKTFEYINDSTLQQLQQSLINYKLESRSAEYLLELHQPVNDATEALIKAKIDQLLYQIKADNSRTPYEKVRSRIDFFNETLESVAFNNTSLPDEYLISNGIDHLLITYEIDQLKKELPETYKKTLELVLNRYIGLQERFTEHIILNAEIPNSGFTLIFSCLLDEVIKHIKSLLNAEQRDSKDSQTKLTQIKTNLSDTQRAKLFDLLVDGAFIPNENKDCFIWVFGNPNEKQPEHFKLIKWNESKALLAHFVDVFNCRVLGNNGREKRTQWKPFELIFNQSGLRGAKNDYQKTGTSPVGNEHIDKIINDIFD